MCLTKARSANLWRQQLLYYTAKLKRHATGCHWEKSKGDHRLLGLNLTTFKVDWMADFPEWWRTQGNAFCIFISILFLKKGPGCGMAVAPSRWWRCIAGDRVTIWYCWDTAVIPGLPSRAVYPLFSITGTSVLFPFLLLGLDLLLAEAFVGLEINLIVCI